MRFRSILLLVFGNIFIFVALVFALEGGARLLLRLKLPFRIVRRASQYFYLNFDRNVVQYLPSCAQYDSIYTYSLKIGQCQFQNREYTTTVRVNSSRFRDSEQDLHSPLVIALGDSQTFGWGVEGDKNFPAILQAMTGLKVLNTATPSYGTVREVLILKKVDLSQASTIIIQYSDNDFRENHHFKRSSNQFIPSSENAYLGYRKHLKVRHDTHFPLKYLRFFVGPMLRSIFSRPSVEPTMDTAAQAHHEAKLFMNVLHNMGVDLTPYKIIVLQVNGYNLNNNLFIDAVQHLADRDQIAPNAKLNISTLDVTPLLTDLDYYYFDDHINVSGHQKIAQALAPLVIGRPHHVS